MNSYEENFGLKSLNSVTIRAYSDLKIGNKKYKAGEPVLWLDKVQIAQLNENKKTVAARGGYHNLPRVIWTDFYDLQFQFVNGLVSKTSLGFFIDSGAIEVEEETSPILVNKKEEIEVSNGKVKLLQPPVTERFFIYRLENGHAVEKINDYIIDDKEIIINEDNVDNILVDYYYEFKKKYTNYKITDKEIDGCFIIEGYADVKSEETGELKTYFFEIPKAKITSNLEMNLGEKANPTLSVFEATGLPVERNGETIVCDMYLLDSDIMSDF